MAHNLPHEQLVTYYVLWV